MNIDKNYAVFGLGRYGRAVAKELMKNGVEVLAVDIDENKVNDVAKDVPYCKCADVTDIEVLKQLGITNFDIVIIAMASNFESNILAVATCKELGVKQIIAKAANETQKKILLKVGANRVVMPEIDSGLRLAKILLNPDFIDMIEITKNISVIEIDVKDEWCDKTLAELDLRKKYTINVVAIIENKNININVTPHTMLKKSMKLLVVANVQELDKLNSK